jgi:PKD repeat protein
MTATFTKKFKHLLCVILFIVVQQHIIAQCTANFNFTLNANGNVSFQSTSTPTLSTGHFWNFGNNQNSSQINPTITYTANGIYTVCLSIWTPTPAPTCSTTICQTINITNAATPTCALNTNYTYTLGAANSVSFTSTSTGTVVGSTYTWFYGDSFSGTGNPNTHTYANPGNYPCKLVVNNGNGCLDSLTSIVTVTAPCNLVTSFNFNQLGNGNVQFVSTSTGTLPTTSYAWFKNNSYITSGNPATHNFINGTYTIMLSAANNVTPTCASQATQVIVVTSNTCNLVASFTHTVTGNSVGFTSTTPGTIAATTYSWDYGDSNSGTGASSNHVYASSGSYMVKLIINNNNGCVDSTNLLVQTTGPCGLNASFIANQSLNGNVNFISTSTGTTNFTNYLWYNGATFMSNGNPYWANFPNGTYTITLIAMNSPSVCSSQVSQVITVTSNTCNLLASFNFTQGAGGSVNYASTSTGTVAGMMYNWDFGDGNILMSGGPTVSHTYSNAGIHNVSMSVYDPNNSICYDSTSIPVNITSVPCIANSNFSMTMITSGYWNAIPSYPWNVVAATWSWGDNTFDNTLYTSHTYSPIGVYNVCLTVSVSCGATSSTCITYTITSPPPAEGSGEHNRSASPISMAYINVIPPQPITITGIKQQAILANSNLIVYPNPSNGKFEISFIGFNEKEARIKVYNITGDLVYEANGNIENGNLNQHITLNHSPGIYFVKIESGNGSLTKKIILKD